MGNDRDCAAIWGYHQGASGPILSEPEYMQYISVDRRFGPQSQPSAFRDRGDRSHCLNFLHRSAKCTVYP